MLLVLGLVVMIYALVGTTTVQVGQYSRRGSEAARVRLELIRAADQLRWQLRGMYVPPGDSRSGNQGDQDSGPQEDPGTEGEEADTPAQLGQPELLPLKGNRTGEEGQDVVRFLTVRPARGEGVVEVGYRILKELPEGSEEEEQQQPEGPFLAYREFPYPDKEGLHEVQDHEEAPWRVLSADVESLEFEYSIDGVVWQREWESSDAPRNVRVKMQGRQADLKLSFVVSPGVAAPRW